MPAPIQERSSALSIDRGELRKSSLALHLISGPQQASFLATWYRVLSLESDGGAPVTPHR